MQRVDRCLCEKENVCDRDQHPQNRQDLPVINAAQGKEHCGKQYHAHMPPAVKGVKQTHGLFLIVRGTSFQNRADQYLDQSAADSVDRHSDQNAAVGIGQQFRQNGQRQQSCRGTDVCQNDRCPIADLVHKSCGQHIHQQLYQKVNGNQKCDLRQRDLISFLKCDKQQRHKVVYHCLHDIADKTGVHRLLIRASHVSDSPPFAAMLPALPLPFWHRRSGWGADDRRCHSLLQKQ